MVLVLILTVIVTLLFFVILSAKVCIYNLGPNRVRESETKKSGRLRLKYKVSRLYLRSWLIAVASIAGVIYLKNMVEPPAPEIIGVVVIGLRATALLAVLTGVLWGEVLLAKLDKMYRTQPGQCKRSEARKSRADDGLSENSRPALR